MTRIPTLTLGLLAALGLAAALAVGFRWGRSQGDPAPAAPARAPATATTPAATHGSHTAPLSASMAPTPPTTTA